MYGKGRVLSVVKKRGVQGMRKGGRKVLVESQEGGRIWGRRCWVTVAKEKFKLDS